MSKVKKQKSIFRIEAIALIIFIVTLLTIYFAFFFTLHLKWLAQKTLTKTYGAEVNINAINLKYFPPQVSINRIQFTNHHKPLENLFEIGNLSFKFNTEDLMFLSFTTDEALLTGFKANTSRSHKGYVSPESQKLLSVSLNLDKNKDAVIAKKTQGNILENILAFSKTKDLDAELNKLSEEFKISELTQKYENKVADQTKKFEEYKTFFKKDHLKDIETQFNALKVKSEQKVFPVTEIIADSKSLITQINSVKDQAKEIKTNIKTQLTEVRNLEADLVKDINEKKQQLKSKFNIPNISPESLAKDFFAETVQTRFYLFKYWLTQLRKNSEATAENAVGKVLDKEKSEFLKEKIKATMEASKEEKEIKKEIAEAQKSKNQIIHFGEHKRPKFWVKKTLIKADASKNQDLHNFTGEIDNIASDQRVINKPITVNLKGNLPKDNIQNMNIKAVLNHHLKNINEEFKISADYPISSFKMINDDSLKLFINKATSSTLINGTLEKNEINNMSIKNNLNNVDFDFNTSKENVQKILGPIINEIKNFNLDIFLKGALNHPDISILSSFANRISAGLKAEVSAQLNQFNTNLEAKLEQKVAPLKSKLFSKLNLEESDLNSKVSNFNSGLDQQKATIDDFIKKKTASSLDKLKEQLPSNLKDKLFK